MGIFLGQKTREKTDFFLFFSKNFQKSKDVYFRPAKKGVILDFFLKKLG